jgi:hypothetical protein
MYVADRTDYSLHSLAGVLSYRTKGGLHLVELNMIYKSELQNRGRLTLQQGI